MVYVCWWSILDRYSFEVECILYKSLQLKRCSIKNKQLKNWMRESRLLIRVYLLSSVIKQFTGHLFSNLTYQKMRCFMSTFYQKLHIFRKKFMHWIWPMLKDYVWNGPWPPTMNISISLPINVPIHMYF